MPVFTETVEILNAAGTVQLTTATATSYEHITWKRPGRPKRRVVEQGAHNDGEVELQSVLDVERLTWEVRIVGTSYADLQTKYDALVAAVESGPGMQVRVTIAGTARTWQCTGDPNITPRTDGRDGDALRWGFREELIVDWPVNPSAY